MPAQRRTRRKNPNVSNAHPEQTHTDQWPEHAAAPNTHNRVLELVRQHLGELNGKKVCDLPCGAGAFSARLAQLEIGRASCRERV